jgi:hypothetical protein
MSTYTGECVGGPMDGQTLAAPAPWIRVSMRSTSVSAWSDELVSIRVGRYDWSDERKRFEWRGDPVSGSDPGRTHRLS